MADSSDEIREWLRAQLRAGGHGAKLKLAKHLGFARPDAITRMLNIDPSKETREIKAKELEKMREFFGDAGPTTTTIPLMGYIGAGAEIDPEHEQVPPDGLDQVVVPFSLPGELVAFKVRGDSMLPRYDEDDVILVWRDQKRPTETFIGEEVALRTDNGRRYLKTLARAPKGFTLISWNARPIESVGIDWIGEIYLTVRASQVRRVGRNQTAAMAR